MSREPEGTDDLREQAERELQTQPPVTLPSVPNDPEQLLRELQQERQELQVHQIELRLQNDELVRTNAELEEARQEYQELFDHAPVGYLTLDGAGSVQRVNLTLCRMLGVERARLLNRRFSAFLDPASISTFTLFLRRMMEHSGPRTAELWLVSAAGTRFAAQIEGEAVQRSGERGPHARLTVTDITPQRQAQDEVLRLNASLEERVKQRTQRVLELNGELETFVYAVTHDLQTPLRHIRSFIGLLVEQYQPLGAEQERYAQHVEHSVDRMEQQLSTLLTFFRTGQGRLRFQEVKLDSVMQEVRRDFAADLEGRDVQLTVDALPTVHGNSLALQLVFANLLGNALKFTRGRAPARISVFARENEREFILGVRDNGVGFNMRQKDRLFAVFQRLHRQGEFEGSGVGLALVRRVVHRHGGRTWAEGKVGEGATFWVSLPRTPQREDLA
ncbi:PAS domain S-box protein [Deinococcus sp. HMF7604]|uniref:sensor histidine kinase n=1 Tax=Deinococcus betulae TaxID=2873312 RepID=UPI001CCC29A4|nr:PAS domain S-box protein [Deinococcus betulae]